MSSKDLFIAEPKHAKLLEGLTETAQWAGVRLNLGDSRITFTVRPEGSKRSSSTHYNYHPAAIKLLRAKLDEICDNARYLWMPEFNKLRSQLAELGYTMSIDKTHLNLLDRATHQVTAQIPYSQQGFSQLQSYLETTPQP